MMDLPALHPIEGPVLVAPDDAILIADGCFLQRPELAGHWDFRLWLDVDFEDVLRRGTERDKAWMGGSADAARARYLAKYIPGERRYIEDVDPRRNAHLVVDNRDLSNPRII
jgi:uridine kinase